jgi:hypothetical protein
MSSDTKKIQIFRKNIASQLSALRRLNIEQFSNRAGSLEKNLKRFGKQNIRGGLVGITSSGKSALLNTLLGSGTQVLKEQSKATTNMIVFCSKSKNPRLEIYFEDGKSHKKSGNEVLSESIWKYTSEDENPHNQSNVKFIKLSLPTFMLEERLEIADTPGLDAFGHKAHEDLTLREFLPQADLVLYLSSIRSPMKDADRNIINKILDADQRIIFVQTCKGAVVEQRFDGGVATSVEEQLVGYREKFEKAISRYPNLKDAPIVQIETTRAMAYFKTKDKDAWRQSGLDELIYIVSETTGQIREEFELIELRRLVDESLGINQLIQNMLKEEDDNRSAASESQKAFSNEIEDCGTEIIEDMAELLSGLNEKLDVKARYGKYKGELSALYTERYNFNTMNDDKFMAMTKWIDDDIKQLKSEFLDAIDTAKKRYTQMLKELGMDVRRIDYQNVGKHAFYLPNVQKKGLADALGLKGHEQADITEKFIDKNKFVKDLEGSLRLFIDPLTKHLDWWRNSMNLSIVTPLKKKIAAITDDITNIEKGTIYDDAQKDALTAVSSGIEGAVRDMIPIFERGAAGRKIKAYSRYIGGFEPVKIDDKNIFLQLSHRLFENLFHSYYLTLINEISSKDKKRIVLVSPHLESGVHFLRRLMRLDQSSAALLLETEPPYSVNAARKLSKMKNLRMKGELYGNVSFFVLANDHASFKIAQEMKLFEKADVVQVMVDDLHRVGSAIRDMVERFYFFRLIYTHRKKLLLTYPAAAHFRQRKLHMLVCEVMAGVHEVFRTEGMHWFIYENFEVRYGYFSRLAGEMHQKKRKVDDMLNEWKRMGLPLDDPFSENILIDQFNRVAKHKGAIC